MDQDKWMCGSHERSFSNLSMYHILLNENRDIKKEIKQRYGLNSNKTVYAIEYGVKEIQQLNLGGPDYRHNIRP